MSKETVEWLNQNTMIGMIKDKAKWAKNNWMILQADGSYKAWWDNGDFNNAYEGFIPMEDVTRVLFNWEPVEAPIMLKLPCDAAQADGEDHNGNPFRWVGDPDKKAIVNPTNDTVYSYVGQNSYQVHGYNKWLMEHPASIVDGELGVISAGLLRRGGVAYVCLSLPEGVTTDKAQMEFRPTLLARTSLDTTAATGYFMTNLIGVCDNSVAAGMASAESKVRIKHSARSLTRIGEVRGALGLIYEDAEQFSKWVDDLVDVDVTDAQFKAIVAGLSPVPDPEVADGKVKNQRAITIASNKQDTMLQMWHADPRCKVWNGTLLGAFQTVNTWVEHEKPQNDNAVDRLMTGTISGSFNKDMDEFWKIVGEIDSIKLPATV